MRKNSYFLAPAGALAAIFISSLGLTGCVAAAVPLIAAEVGAVGFAGYKLVQTSTGGEVGVDFPEDKNGSGPDPLPAVKKIAVWPVGAGDVHFAEELSKSGKLKVVPPARVSALLSRAGISENLKMMTVAEQETAYARVCRSAGSELVFATHPHGQKMNNNTFSLSRATITYTTDLTAYSCKKRQTVWKDRISLVQELGQDNIASNEELNRIGAEAEADRVLQAMKLKSASG